MTDDELLTTQARIIDRLLDRCQMWRDVADLQNAAMRGVTGVAIDAKHAQWWRDAVDLYDQALNAP